MSPDEQAALADRAQRQQIDTLAEQARDAAIAVWRGQAMREQVVPQLEDVATKAADGHAAGSPWDEVAQFLCALVALLNGQPAPPVPTAYARHLAAVMAARINVSK